MPDTAQLGIIYNDDMCAHVLLILLPCAFAWKPTLNKYP